MATLDYENPSTTPRKNRASRYFGCAVAMFSSFWTIIFAIVAFSHIEAWALVAMFALITFFSGMYAITGRPFPRFARYP